ncbi:hypothetical protein BAUCODRAFT_575021 [Baudoinia panamericana UAMH 10762]|uniref:tRNA (adenine(58)-N(1))-methyltransferase non-catalytic subunit TRM6 n=1 Tax=Baudoinia panamericana (strain UAMH 10762) TaxID=717646 RepID=M2ND92_BAUPA|nr:uncharacterized protein BAUCODRAFT_575021 [Baudoinia panamericana UAMH 10762]EMC97179.1 hypothetical protein BAUCODRAFT_575021 [Baudoinia panamericana UAMH 10762]
MTSALSYIKPNTWLFLRLPSKSLKILEIKPNTIIDAGKLGSFPSNLLLGRPYYYTYEILEKREDEACSRLRRVPPSELNAEIVNEDATPNESRGEPTTPSGVPVAFEMTEDIAVETKTNRLTVDDANRQALSQAEIEEMKRSTAGKEIIEKILANHSGLDEKTVFSRAKYLLRKRNKYLRRFMALPMDIGNIITYITEKEPHRILDIREEALGLVCAWSNAHVTSVELDNNDTEASSARSGRWLVVDETGGLLVAALAERMGILHKTELPSEGKAEPTTYGTEAHDTSDNNDGGVSLRPETAESTGAERSIANGTPKTEHVHRDFPTPAHGNTITLLHPAVQPNISILKYFGYDSNTPDPAHPMHTHLKSLSWLQLLHPEEDPTYREPEVVPEAQLTKWKSGKRGTYWKKRRRWERCKNIVDEAREGGFDGLVIASNMDPATILPHAVPLLRGGGELVIYSPTIEPLVQLMDLYSKERRTAYINLLAKGEMPSTEDFPVDPRLLLAPTLQTSRVREWQVLPGRTHPMMTGRGGSEGYVMTARRVIPLEGGVEARGNFSAKRKRTDTADATSAP